MPLLRGFGDDHPPEYRGGVVSIGNFDGVHRGHGKILETLVARANEIGRPAVVLTFDPHPIRLLRPEAEPPSLSTLERKAELLTAAGVDVVIAYPTDQALLDLSPEGFFETIVRGRLDAAGLVEGPNFYFGKNRGGDVATLRELTEAAGMSLDVVEPLRVGEDYVSSSRIRTAIASGDVSTAVELLGHHYRVSGIVERGAGRGRELDTPTANLAEIRTLLPAPGVYAGRTEIDGDAYTAAVNIGPNPTFGDDAMKVEAHLVGYEGDLYGRSLALDFVDRIRDVRTFDSVEELQTQIAADVARAVAVTATA